MKAGRVFRAGKSTVVLTALYPCWVTFTYPNWRSLSASNSLHKDFEKGWLMVGKFIFVKLVIKTYRSIWRFRKSKGSLKDDKNKNQVILSTTMSISTCSALLHVTLQPRSLQHKRKVVPTKCQGQLGALSSWPESHWPAGRE